MLLAQAVAGLREERKTAQAEPVPQMQFRVRPVQEEFSVITGREGGPQVKVRFRGIEAGATVKRSASKTQKVSLELVQARTQRGRSRRGPAAQAAPGLLHPERHLSYRRLKDACERTDGDW